MALFFQPHQKKNAPPALGINVFSQLIKNKKCPAVAIGGINMQNIKQVMQTSIDGVATVSAICGQTNIKDATTQLSTIIHDVKQIRG